MKLVNFFVILLYVMPAAPLRAEAPEAAPLTKREKNLERMQANRDLDTVNTQQAQQDFSKVAAQMSVRGEQQAQDARDLKSVEKQVTAGKKQKTLARENYKETVRQYGSDDPRSTAAKKKWKQKKQGMAPLLEDRQALKKDIQRGNRQAHNDKTVLSVHERTMDSNARYRASDDRKILKEEKNIAEDRKEMAENIQSSAVPSPK